MLIGKTEFVATSQANIVKIALIAAREEGAQKLGLDASSITVDSPVPYKLSTFKAKVDVDKPSQASKQDSHNSILQKLEVLMTDARLRFMMTEWNDDGNDPFPVVIRQLTGDGLSHALSICLASPTKSLVYRVLLLLEPYSI